LLLGNWGFALPCWGAYRALPDLAGLLDLRGSRFKGEENGEGTSFPQKKISGAAPCIIIRNICFVVK